MSLLLLKNARLVNEGTTEVGDLLIKGERIEKIASSISADAGTRVIDLDGKLLMPGMIDDQVHFREPGLTHKGSIATESAAAIAGGTTSFMEMPNVSPQTTTIEALEEKYQRAQGKSLANFSFYLGATNDNLEQIKRLDPNQACGLKVFMGSSTGNMLVDNPQTLDEIFSHSPVLIATHCEDSPTISANEQAAREKYGEDVPFSEHPNIRSAEACYLSSSLAASLAHKHQARLHILHLTTAKELELLTPTQNISDLKTKLISAEVCVHHLFYCDADYERLGSLIKCNPAIKTQNDRDALRLAVREQLIDIIATDHAPHTWDEKQGSYFNAPSGLPLCQHSLQLLMELCHQGEMTQEMIAQKTSHAVAERYQLKDRGYLREGYYADLVAIDPTVQQTVDNSSLYYKCGWSPLSGQTLNSRIEMTLLNGDIAYHDGQLNPHIRGKRLEFDR
ncbi:dihydroorotase [Dongshaea marina]|uniref:dihydroorotase n=1 Tax=Dongshaea marina TaxID=2047966 RepID=UPI000D3E092B|nr:dihydroorotase [Dongshaea marina]